MDDICLFSEMSLAAGVRDGDAIAHDLAGPDINCPAHRVEANPPALASTGNVRGVGHEFVQ